MSRNTCARLLSAASLLSFVACVLFAVASVATGMENATLLSATLLCLFWSYLASRRAEACLPGFTAD